MINRPLDEVSQVQHIYTTLGEIRKQLNDLDVRDFANNEQYEIFNLVYQASFLLLKARWKLANTYKDLI